MGWVGGEALKRKSVPRAVCCPREKPGSRYWRIRTTSPPDTWKRESMKIALFPTPKDHAKIDVRNLSKCIRRTLSPEVSRHCPTLIRRIFVDTGPDASHSVGSVSRGFGDIIRLLAGSGSRRIPVGRDRHRASDFRMDFRPMLDRSGLSWA